jgi:hypothetical protein
MNLLSRSASSSPYPGRTPNFLQKSTVIGLLEVSNWLNALPGPLLNQPTPQGPYGNWRHPSAWAVLAARAGLALALYRRSREDDPTETWRAASERPAATMLVVGDQVVALPMLSAECHESCRRPARVAGTMLLGIDCAPTACGGSEFSGDSVIPDLIRGGEALAKAFA